MLRAGEIAVLDSAAYKRAQSNPTESTRRCSPEMLGTTYIRNVYTMIHPRVLAPAQRDEAPHPMT